MSAFNLNQKVIDLYGEREYTFREMIENGKMKIEKRNNIYTKWKNEYYGICGMIEYRLNGNQAKKYIK